MSILGFLLMVSWLPLLLVVSWLPLLLVVSELAVRFCSFLRSLGSTDSSLRGERGNEAWRGLEDVVEGLRLDVLSPK